MHHVQLPPTDIYDIKVKLPNTTHCAAGKLFWFVDSGEINSREISYPQLERDGIAVIYFLLRGTVRLKPRSEPRPSVNRVSNRDHCLTPLNRKSVPRNRRYANSTAHIVSPMSTFAPDHK